MADDWDLYAVVRGCKSTAQTTTNTTTAAATTAIVPTTPIHTPSEEFADDPFWDLLINSDELTDPLFSFPDLDNPKDNDLQEQQQSFFPNPTTTTNNKNNNPSTNNTTFGPNNIIPISPTISDFGGSSGSGQHHLQQHQQQHHAQLQQQLQQQQQNQQHHLMPDHFTRGIPAPAFRGIYGQQQQQMMQRGYQILQPRQPQNQQGFMRPGSMNPAYPLPRLPITMPLHTPRSQRRRRTQQNKKVCEVKAEDLTADLWAWRKYGQKPIKGSPHPRNYYRCSTSKGCAARKHVERSTTDPNIFTVTYSGDHTHARPTHRNSLAGTSRNKLSAASKCQKQPINNDSGSAAVPNPSSPTTGQPLTVQAEAVANKDNSDNSLDRENEEFNDDDEEMDETEYGDEDEDDDVVIPDMDMSDEIFLGQKELGSTSSSGSGSSSMVGASGDNFLDNVQSSLGSSWTDANCSSAAGATVGSGCY